MKRSGQAMSFFAGRKLRVCLALNAFLVLSLAAAMTSGNLWSASALKIAALLLLVNAIVVLIVGAILIFPALLDSPADEKKFESLLARHAGLTGDVRNAVLASIRAEADALRQRAHMGRVTVVTGAIFLILAFGSATATLTRVLPADSILANSAGPVLNQKITEEAAWRFAGDQVSGALFLDIPELYHWYLTDLVNNTKAPAFTTLTFAFRAVLGWVSLVTMITLARSFRLRRRSASARARVTKAPAQTAAGAISGLEIASRSMAE
jgi:hypothetical protein